MEADLKSIIPLGLGFIKVYDESTHSWQLFQQLRNYPSSFCSSSSSSSSSFSSSSSSSSSLSSSSYSSRNTTPLHVHCSSQIPTIFKATRSSSSAAAAASAVSKRRQLWRAVKSRCMACFKPQEQSIRANNNDNIEISSAVGGASLLSAQERELRIKEAILYCKNSLQAN